MSQPSPLQCPSAQPGMKGLRLLGVVESTSDGPRVAYLNEDVPVTEELLHESAPVRPTDVFRLAAQCEESRCLHFDGQRCNLATRIVQVLPVVVEALPICLIRSTCRWYQQEGAPACFRCPQVITEASDTSEEIIRAALPEMPFKP